MSSTTPSEGRRVHAADARLTELVRARGPALVGYAYLLVGDRGAAEDLVQEAFVKVFVRMRDAGPPDAMEAYVRRTMAGRLWFQADTQHLHHRMLELGHSHRRAVFLLWLWT